MVEKDLNIAIVQFDVSWESSDINLNKIEQVLSNLKSKADLILLPEMFNSGFTMKPQNIASSMDGDVVQWMKMLAKSKDSVICGSIAIKEYNRYYNRFIAAFPNGELEWYDKRHLFRMGGENKIYSAGNKRKIINVKGWRCALFVCYDLRFPVWNRSNNDYDMALYVANWPKARIDVWNTLLHARAIENQCYVAACNRIGSDVYCDYSGDSMVIDFKGKTICYACETNQLLLEASLSYDELNCFKEEFPAWMDADKFSIYDADII